MAKKAAKPLKKAVPVKSVKSVKPVEKVKKAEKAGLRKQYLKSGLCRVAFRLPFDAAEDARTVTLAGDFNGWDKTDTPLKRLTNGDFTVSLDLEPNREYRFRYLINGTKWENDWCADKYIRNPHGSDDSVVCC